MAAKVDASASRSMVNPGERKRGGSSFHLNLIPVRGQRVAERLVP